MLSDDAGMRMLLPKELKHRFECPVEVCTPAELLSNPERAIGALVVSPQGHIPRIRSVLAAEPSAVAITYSSADEHLQAIRELKTPSLIAVVSVSDTSSKWRAACWPPQSAGVTRCAAI